MRRQPRISKILPKFKFYEKLNFEVLPDMSGNSLRSQACRILVARFLAALQWLAADFFFALQSKPRRRSFPVLSHLRPSSAREHFFQEQKQRSFSLLSFFLSIFCEKKLHPFCLQTLTGHLFTSKVFEAEQKQAKLDSMSK